LTLASGASIASGPYAVTLAGATMGPITAGNATGITVSTNKDAASAGAPSGRLGGQVINVLWTIADSDRVPSATNKPITVSFNLFTALQAADTITISYPQAFIAASPTPTAIPSNATAGPPGATSIVLTLASGASIASGPYAVTLAGATMGGATSGSQCGITVSTNKDAASAGAPSGPIGNRVTNVWWAIADSDRVPSATNKPITVSFNLFTALQAADTITISYPQAFIAASPTPTAIPSNATAGPPGPRALF